MATTPWRVPPSGRKSCPCPSPSSGFTSGLALAAILVTVSHVPDPKAHEKKDEFIERGLKLHDLIWPVIGNELPIEVHDRLVGPIDRLGDPRERSEDSIGRTQRIFNVYDGLLAAQYHRDNIERIEVELVRRFREAYPEGSRPGVGGVSSLMPVVAHEYVAYLFAARRTLDYLAQAVSVLFGLRVFSIKDLARSLPHGKPKDLAAQAAALGEGVIERFPDLLSAGEARSDRDQAAHYTPIAPATPVDRVLPGRPRRDRVPRRRTRDTTADGDARSRADEQRRPDLTQAIDARLADLHELCGDLIDLAIQAEEWRLAQPEEAT
jgi:hypothetical protein